MAHDFCPDTITLPDGTVCRRYETFTDRYICGILAVEVCNYVCPDRRAHSLWRLKILGLAASGVGSDTFDPSQPPPPPGGLCPPTHSSGEAQCVLAAHWTIRFLGGLMKIEVCIYACADGRFYITRWRTWFLGIPLPWRERATFPYPI